MDCWTSLRVIGAGSAGQLSIFGNVNVTNRDPTRYEMTTRRQIDCRESIKQQSDAKQLLSNETNSAGPKMTATNINWVQHNLRDTQNSSRVTQNDHKENNVSALRICHTDTLMLSWIFDIKAYIEICSRVRSESRFNYTILHLHAFYIISENVLRIRHCQSHMSLPLPQGQLVCDKCWTCLQTVTAICLPVNDVKDVFLDFFALKKGKNIMRQVYYCFISKINDKT